jgi:hypothetical protein
VAPDEAVDERAVAEGADEDGGRAIFWFVEEVRCLGGDAEDVRLEVVSGASDAGVVGGVNDDGRDGSALDEGEAAAGAGVCDITRLADGMKVCGNAKDKHDYTEKAQTHRLLPFRKEQLLLFEAQTKSSCGENALGCSVLM